MKKLLYILTIVLITNLSASATDEQKKSFEKECNNGDTISCYNMGLMYDYGDGNTAEDDKKALGFYLKACDKNYYDGCSKAALLYEEGKNVKQDMKEAFKLYSKACGADVAGVDIIYDLEKEEYVVLEVNGIPAFATPEQEKMGLNFNDKKIDLIVDLIDRKTKK